MMEQLTQQSLHLVQVLLGFTYYYPLFMAYLWSLGALWFYLRYEYRQQTLPLITSQPRVSILVPCYNEEQNVEETISHLFNMSYSNYEIIAINDGSDDCTANILAKLARQNDKLYIIHNAKNQGKSISLNTAAKLATGEIIIGIDGDALLDHDAIHWFLKHFENNPQVGAVTGNPRIRTRSTLLGRLQVGEFSSLVGLIKRAQWTFYRRLFTASGVITAFRRSALEDVDYWSPTMLTEDMDITWKLQIRDWEVHFEPRALAWILMPETAQGLWQQRLRWAMGGMQIIGKYKKMFFHWRTYPMWPLFLEHIISVAWAYTVALLLLFYSIDAIASFYHIIAPLLLESSNTSSTHSAIALAPSIVISATALLPEFSGVIIGTTALLQMLLSMFLDRHYDHKLLRYYVWVIWYPFGFWLLNMATIVVALPITLLRQSNLRSRWKSPDRGI